MSTVDLDSLGSFERIHWYRECADGWIVGYTTTPLIGGSDPGKFAVAAYRPTGKGARTGQANRWEVSYARLYRRRKDARARAEALWRQHEARARRDVG